MTSKPVRRVSVDRTATRTTAVIAALIEAADGVNARNKIARSNPRGKTIDLSAVNVRRVRTALHGLSAVIKSRVKFVRAKIVRHARPSSGVIVNDRMIGPTTSGPMIEIGARNAAIATRPRAKHRPALRTTCQLSCARPRGLKLRTNRPAL